MRVLAVVLVLAAGCIQQSGPRTQLEAAVSDQDVEVFRAVLKSGLIPPPPSDVAMGDPLSALQPDTAMLPTVRRTIRICNTRDPADAVFCIPERAIRSIAAHATATQVSSLMNGNAAARVIPADQLVVVSGEEVFRGLSRWGAVWSQAKAQPLPDCVLFSTPVSEGAEVALYAVRLWRNSAYGWYVRLRGDTSEWRAYRKQLVWWSPPAV